VLDVGTGAGASALWLGAAMALAGGHVITVERDAARYTQAQRNLRQAGLERRVEPRLGELGRLVAKLGGPLDLIFLDEAAEDRADDLRLLLPLCAPGALVISHAGTASPAALAQVNALVQLDPRIHAALRLPVGGGVMVAVVG
jgi:predicted O-methyltransferase YrrM